VETTSAPDAWLPFPQFPLEARALHAQGDCLVDVTVNAEGRPETVVSACNEVFRPAARDAALAAGFGAGEPGRTFTVNYPFVLDSGFTWDVRVGVLASAYGLCVDCAAGGIAEDDSALLQLGRVHDGSVLELVAGTRDGGLEVGLGASERVFWQHAVSPVVGLRGALVYGAGSLPAYAALTATAGLSVHVPGQRWSVAVHGGADARLGLRYYRALAPDLGVSLALDVPPPGARARLHASNLPRVVAVTGPAPPPRSVLLTTPDPAEVLLGDLHLGLAPDPAYPPTATHYALSGSCAVRVTLGADGVPGDVRSADCPGAFYDAAAVAARAARFAPFVGWASGAPAPVAVVLTYDFAAGHAALRRETARSDMAVAAVAGEQPRFAACAGSAVEADPAVAGRVTISWRIAKGAVEGDAVLEDTTGSERFAACLGAAVRALTFDDALTTRVPAYTWTLGTAAAE